MLKKLVPGVLALALVANVNANTDVETKEKEEAKVAAFVKAAKELGASNEDVVNAFVSAVKDADQNGVTTLSLTLNNEQKKVAIVVGGVAVVAIVAAGVYYRDGYKPFGKLFKRADTAPVAEAAAAPAAEAAAAPAAI